MIYEYFTASRGFFFTLTRLASARLLAVAVAVAVDAHPNETRCKGQSANRNSRARARGSVDVCRLVVKGSTGSSHRT